MALRRQIVDLVRLNCLDDADQVGGVRHVAVMDLKMRAGNMRVLINVIDAGGVERRGAALDAMDDISLSEQKFGEIGAILAGDTGDECDFGHDILRYVDRLNEPMAH